MRAMWKGAISFGLLNIPVKMSTATQRKQVAFHQLHKECHTPIKQKRFCPHCQEEVPYQELVKGYPVDDDTYVVIRTEDFHKLPLKSIRSIDILDFIQLQEIDPLYFHKTYYLTPQEGGEKPYLLLKEVMAERGRVAVTKITIRQKESLALIRIMGDLLGLETLFYAEEVRSTDVSQLQIALDRVQIHPREREMALELVDNLTTSFHLEKYRDEYQEALQALIQKKMEGEEVQSLDRDWMKEGRVVNIMEKLKASVEQTKRMPKVQSKD